MRLALKGEGKVHLLILQECFCLFGADQDCQEAEDCIDAHVEPELTQNERDALISLIYNIGCGNFKGSTLLMLLNAGNMTGAANQFGRWDRAAGRVMPGLQARREAETQLFLEA